MEGNNSGLSIMHKNQIEKQVRGLIFDKAIAAADLYLNLPFNLETSQFMIKFIRDRTITASDVIAKIQTIVVAPSTDFVFAVKPPGERSSKVAAWGVPITNMQLVSTGSSIGAYQSDSTKTSGELVGLENSTKTKQEDLFSSIIRIDDSTEIINKGEIKQKGIQNLPGVVGIGGRFGIVNFGRIISTGATIFGGFGRAFGVFNAGSVKLSGGTSFIIGGGVLNGIWNLGELQSSNKSDIVAGISGGIGIANGFDLNPALYPDIRPKTLKVLQAAATASEINTKEGDDLIYGGGLYNVNDFLSKLPSTPEFASQLLAGIISTNPNSKDASIGILNFGKINTGLGNDVVFGAGDDITAPENMAVLSAAGIGSIGSGVINAKTGMINLGEGDDLLVGETWAVNQPNDGESPRAGIVNYGLINTGDGNDHICGFSGTTAQANKGIFNDGIIDTGDGDDIVDGITGGFAGSGVMNLGDGSDTLIGFGTGTFNAGVGYSDKLLLGDGVYSITKEDLVTTIVSNGVAMISTGFESISGNVGGGVIILPGMGMSLFVICSVQDGVLTA